MPYIQVKARLIPFFSFPMFFLLVHALFSGLSIIDITVNDFKHDA